MMSSRLRSVRVCHHHHLLLPASSSPHSTLSKLPPCSSGLISCCCDNPSQLSLPNKTLSLSRIHSSGVIACLRAPSADLALGAARAALDGGISVLEVVASCPGVFEVISQLVREHPTKTIGVGTVLNVHDARRAMEAGALFLMSPAMINVPTYSNIVSFFTSDVISLGLSLLFTVVVFTLIILRLALWVCSIFPLFIEFLNDGDQDVCDEIRGTEVLYIPGAMTPTEIFSARNAGAEMVKVYPVSALGGVKYIGALKKPYPHIPMIASQGITIDLMSEYIARGSCGVVLSDAIFDKKAIYEKDFTAISQLANQAASLGSEAVKLFRLKQGG